VLLALLSGMFVGIGAALGGGFLWIFIAFSVVMNVAAYWMSDKFAIKASRAKPVSEQDAPDLHRMVEELARLFDVPKPRVYMIPSEQPNAFATGRNPQKAVVAVTEGLLKHLSRDQVRAVIAHEFAHIKNRDILVASIAALIAGAISAIGNIFFFMSILGDDEDNPLGAIGSIVMIIIAPIAALMLQMAVSRQREYLADATAARVLGTGEPLAGALETLEAGRQQIPMQVNPAMSSLYIVHPFRGVGMANLFSTHPPITERIKRLRDYDRNIGLL
jgi:heat shock protein HtpX